MLLRANNATIAHLRTARCQVDTHTHARTYILTYCITSFALTLNSWLANVTLGQLPTVRACVCLCVMQTFDQHFVALLRLLPAAVSWSHP